MVSSIIDWPANDTIKPDVCVAVISYFAYVVIGLQN